MSTASSPTPTIPESWTQDPAEVVPSGMLASCSSFCCIFSTLHGRYGVRWCLHIAPHVCMDGHDTKTVFSDKLKPRSGNPDWTSEISELGQGGICQPLPLPSPCPVLPACSPACCCFLFCQR